MGSARHPPRPRLTLVRAPDGEFHHVRIFLYAVLADLEEAWDMLHQKHAGTEWPDLRYLIPKNKLTAVGELYAARTEEQHKQVRRSPARVRAHPERRLGIAISVCCTTASVMRRVTRRSGPPPPRRLWLSLPLEAVRQYLTTCPCIQPPRM